MGATCCGCRINPIDEVQRDKINEIINFWFLNLSEWDRHTCAPPSDRYRFWFSGNHLDDEIKEKFEDCLLKLISGEYNGW